MRHRELNSFSTIKEILNFLGDSNRVGRDNTWIAKNYNVSQLIKDLHKIHKEENK